MISYHSLSLKALNMVNAARGRIFDEADPELAPPEGLIRGLF